MHPYLQQNMPHPHPYPICPISVLPLLTAYPSSCKPTPMYEINIEEIGHMPFKHLNRHRSIIIIVNSDILSGGISKFIIWCACLWINIFSQIVSSFFMLTDFNKVADLLISCQVFQTCDAMADFSRWFNLRFLKCSFVLVSKFLYVCLMYTFSHCLQSIL